MLITANETINYRWGSELSGKEITATFYTKGNWYQGLVGNITLLENGPVNSVVLDGGVIYIPDKDNVKKFSSESSVWEQAFEDSRMIATDNRNTEVYQSKLPEILKNLFPSFLDIVKPQLKPDLFYSEEELESTEQPEVALETQRLDVNTADKITAAGILIAHLGNNDPFVFSHFINGDSQVNFALESSVIAAGQRINTYGSGNRFIEVPKETDWDVLIDEGAQFLDLKKYGIGETSIWRYPSVYRYFQAVANADSITQLPHDLRRNKELSKQLTTSYSKGILNYIFPTSWATLERRTYEPTIKKILSAVEENTEASVYPGIGMSLLISKNNDL